MIITNATKLKLWLDVSPNPSRRCWLSAKIQKVSIYLLHGAVVWYHLDERMLRIELTEVSSIVLSSSSDMPPGNEVSPAYLFDGLIKRQGNAFMG